MAAATINSVGVALAIAKPLIPLSRELGALISRADTTAVATTNIDDVGDKILSNMFPSSAKIRKIIIRNGDMDSNGSPTLAVDIGLAYTGIGGTQDDKSLGDVVDVDAFQAASIILQSESLGGNDVRFTTSNLSGINDEAWEVGGVLSADPKGLLCLSLTVTTAAATGVAKDLSIEVVYI